MIVITGGAYQGKLVYAMEQFSLLPEEVWDCADGFAPGPQYRLLNRFEEGIRLLLEHGENPQAFLERHEAVYKDRIVVCTDIGGGIVPADPALRRWREETGRAITRLCRDADRVIRVFCGIGMVLR